MLSTTLHPSVYNQVRKAELKCAKIARVNHDRKYLDPQLGSLVRSCHETKHCIGTLARHKSFTGLLSSYLTIFTTFSIISRLGRTLLLALPIQFRVLVSITPEDLSGKDLFLIWKRITHSLVSSGRVAELH